MKRITVLTGAGISSESGISTFRDSNGLWENHDILEVASPQGWMKNKKLVLDFYNQRRKQLLEVTPNDGHRALVRLEKYAEVRIVTQNVDDLHERAGSSKVLHLHGELLKARSTLDENLIYDWHGDLNIGDCCEKGAQLRPHIVWFGEQVPKLIHAANFTAAADILIIVGTSMQVYPAAGLVAYAKREIPIYYIDPKPNISHELKSLPNLEVIPKKAGEGLPELVDKLIQNM